MKSVLHCSIHLIALTAVLFLTGCQQRPNRPSPDQTMSGMGPGDNLPFDVVETGGAGFGGGFGTADDLFFDSDSTLQARGDGSEYGEQVRGVLEPIYFEFDRSSLGQAERDKAMAAAEYLRNNPNHNLLIEGHCDWRGTTEYNLGLGDRRASSVKDYLVSIGVDRSRLEILSKGDLEAIQGGTEREMARDRRAEFVVLKN